MAIKLTCGNGAENLTNDERTLIDKISEEYISKITRHGGEINEFDIHLKCHMKEGKSKRYAVEVLMIVNGKHRFESSGDDWNLTDSMHFALKKIMSEIEHKITREKLDKSWKKKARVKY